MHRKKYDPGDRRVGLLPSTSCSTQDEKQEPRFHIWAPVIDLRA